MINNKSQSKIFFDLIQEYTKSYDQVSFGTDKKVSDQFCDNLTKTDNTIPEEKTSDKWISKNCKSNPLNESLRASL